MIRAPGNVDIAIIGGGLAGLTLALQLRQVSPNSSIVVLEKSDYPPAAAAHKVGESTVEIGAHYLGQVLGLKEMLLRTQLRKFGLRYFVGSGQHDDLARADELGTSEPFTLFSYQLDRGTLETDLIDLARKRQIDVRSGCRLLHATINPSNQDHELRVNDNGDEYSVQCRWAVDATGRTAMLKRQMAMRRTSDHKISTAWFRLDDSISVDDWSSDEQWKNRCNGHSRRLSTNHLMGSGYWTWIIPLVNGRTSIGLVADPAIHPLSSYDSFEKFRRWLRNNQPLLADRVDNSASELMDFLKIRNFSHRSERVWSQDRWALTGVSGLFADPFYSPGSDFIALSNTFITDLITGDYSDPERSMRSALYEKLYRSFYDSTMTIYQDQYPGFGDTRLISIKQVWDYAYYWSVLAWLFFREVLTDLTFLRAAQQDISRIRALNARMQAAFSERAANKFEDSGRGRFIDPTQIPILAKLNAALIDPSDTPQQELQENCERLERLAPKILDILSGESTADSGDCELLGDLERRLS